MGNDKTYSKEITTVVIIQEVTWNYYLKRNPNTDYDSREITTTVHGRRTHCLFPSQYKMDFLTSILYALC